MATVAGVVAAQFRASEGQQLECPLSDDAKLWLWVDSRLRLGATVVDPSRWLCRADPVACVVSLLGWYQRRHPAGGDPGRGGTCGS